MLVNTALNIITLLCKNQFVHKYLQMNGTVIYYNAQEISDTQSIFYTDFVIIDSILNTSSYYI